MQMEHKSVTSKLERLSEQWVFLEYFVQCSRICPLTAKIRKVGWIIIFIVSTTKYINNIVLNKVSHSVRQNFCCVFLQSRIPLNNQYQSFDFAHSTAVQQVSCKFGQRQMNFHFYLTKLYFIFHFAPCSFAGMRLLCGADVETIRFFSFLLCNLENVSKS